MIYALDGIVPQIDPTAWVAPGCHIIGRIVLEAEVGVWFNVTMRGDNEPIVIGRGSNVQENCVLHTDMGCPLTVGADCTIGHKAMLHGCTIGEGSLVGIQAIVLNGAIIGRECLIGAGALIPEGKVIPDRSLVMGAPGKVVRQLSDQEAAAIRRGCAQYAERARRYERELQRLPE